MKQVISRQKDPGKLYLCNQVVENINFKQCVLSMTGASSRSRLERCQFNNIKLSDCTIGHAIFDKCNFKNVVSTETITLYESLFLECRFAGKIKNLNFGKVRTASSFFSEDRYSNDIAETLKSSFSLDITDVTDMDECAFAGDIIAQKIKFRPKQGLILKGERLDVVLGSTIRSTEDMGLAVVISMAVGHGALYNLHFCAVPTKLQDKAAKYASIIRDLGVEVIEEPLENPIGDIID